ncbi:hypothetical protein CCGE531_29670 (plasmid) [Rhizobium sp. CCGE531]|nr:hypothetical protein CCGE531_29670 [Rhizobium sp. CCGE531]AYG76573.1 hypothetical protein CCGE532_29145 [Rhizobium sp. CCGE532]
MLDRFMDGPLGVDARMPYGDDEYFRRLERQFEAANAAIFAAGSLRAVEVRGDRSSAPSQNQAGLTEREGRQGSNTQRK